MSYNAMQDLAAFHRLERWMMVSHVRVIGYTGIIQTDSRDLWECNLEDGALDTTGTGETLASAIDQALDRMGAAA